MGEPILHKNRKNYSSIQETNKQGSTMRVTFLTLAVLAVATAAPVQQRGVITDVATKLQDVIDGINHVLHPDAPVTKRDLVDVPNSLEGVLGEISKILTPGAKRGVITDVAKQLQGVIDGINHVLHPDTQVTKR